MSYGFAARGRRAVMRGPMVSSLVNQLVFSTVWEDLDYLVVDMPPGNTVSIKLSELNHLCN